MNNNRCLYCNEVIPEGRHICWRCEHGVAYNSKSPSEKQIRLAEDIAYTLEIDFPLSSRDFTSQTYWKFINENIKDAKSYWSECESDEWLYDMDWFSPLNQ